MEREEMWGEFSKGTQSVRFESVWRMGELDDHTDVVRVTIKRDFYDFQSEAKAEVFNPVHNAWQEVARLWPDNMEVVALGQRKPEPGSTDEATYYSDAETLLDRVEAILEAVQA